MNKIPELKLSKKGIELIDFYKFIVEVGYRNDCFNPGKYNITLKNFSMNIKLKRF